MKVLVIGNLGYVGIPAINLLKKNKIFSIGLDCNWFSLNSYSSNSYFSSYSLYCFESLIFINKIKLLLLLLF